MAIPKSVLTPSGTVTPNSADRFTALHARDARMTPFDGTHPTFRQSPPIKWRSIRAAFAPSPAATTRGDQSGGAGSDDDDIVSTVGRGVRPGWRMDVVNELLIELVHRSHGHGFAFDDHAWCSPWYESNQRYPNRPFLYVFTNSFTILAFSYPVFERQPPFDRLRAGSIPNPLTPPYQGEGDGRTPVPPDKGGQGGWGAVLAPFVSATRPHPHSLFGNAPRTKGRKRGWSG